MKKILSLFHTIGEKTWLRRALQVLAVLAVSFLQAFQLHYSLAGGFGAFFRLGPALLLLNTAILLWLNLGAKLLFQKWHISIAVTALLTTAWSVANFYVVKFHGSPLLFSEFANFGTAMNVLGGYHLAWERRLSWMILLGLAELAAAGLLALCRKRNTRFWNLRQTLYTLGAFGGVSLLLWLSLFVWQKPKPRDTISWTWREGVSGYGYPAVIVEDVDRSIHYLRRPESYSPDLLRGNWAQILPLLFIAATIVYGSAMALKQGHLKRRLAYSTVANLSYVLFGTLLMTSSMIFLAFS